MVVFFFEKNRGASDLLWGVVGGNMDRGGGRGGGAGDKSPRRYVGARMDSMAGASPLHIFFFFKISAVAERFR